MGSRLKKKVMEEMNTPKPNNNLALAISQLFVAACQQVFMQSFAL